MKRWVHYIPMLIPPGVALWVWLSALAFVPVPWPDDSAFYFVAKDLFKWPPRWVMLPQAPFEPTYAIYNFNTMPLYPLLIGLGRLIGIDGSFALKLWPLGAWAASGSLLIYVLLQRGLPALLAALVALVFSLDPALRWASVLVRPESLIGLCGVALVLGTGFGFPKRWEPRKFWDPCAALLAIGAYAHFNAVYLVPICIVAYRWDLRRIFAIGWKTALYLVPWMITVAIHPLLFIHQMRLQWDRLAVGNSWLDSPKQAISSLFQELGSPTPWPEILWYAGVLIWAVMLLGVAGGFIYPIVRELRKKADPSLAPLVPAAAWILASSWLWHSKPEVWFMYYVHAAVWTFSGVATFVLWKRGNQLVLGALLGLLVPSAAVFAIADVQQATTLGSGTSWNWKTYDAWIDCIDGELTKLDRELEARQTEIKPFRVWAPTWPDITIELSRRHPNWEFTRTNDFTNRNHLAIQHGRDVEAVVVAESLNWEEREISEPILDPAKVNSLWLNWKEYFLNRLWTDPNWKAKRRFNCQRGRWQAFLFMESR